MMSKVCDICRGDGRVRLPIYRSMTADYNASAPIEPGDSFREYPCPECSSGGYMPTYKMSCAISHNGGLYGPFSSPDEALAWWYGVGPNMVIGQGWNVVFLKDPREISDRLKGR